MSAKDPATAAAESAAKELVKAAYGDLIQPAAQEIGVELQEFVRAVVVAGRGFGYLIRETYEPFVLRALLRVPKERRIMPPSSLFGAILEGISYASEGSHVEKMSASLLASAMDEAHSANAHPAFVDVIHRISEQELEILKLVEKQIITVMASPQGSSFINIRFIYAAKISGLTNNDLAFDNLNSAGLITFVRSEILPERIRNLEDIAEAVTSLGRKEQRSGDFRVSLSPFGRAFLATCTPTA